MRDTFTPWPTGIKKISNLVSWIRDSRLAQESGQEAFVLLPITASLAHDETAAAEVHGRGPSKNVDSLCSKRVSSRATDDRKSEGDYNIVFLLL
jgi:hypothetical protein